MSCRTVTEFLDSHANDVSRGGIFVRNAQVLAVGCTVRLNLQLADGSTLLAGEGTVFWTREADPTRAESEPGMGIRFTRLTNESQRMLTHLLAEKTERERQQDDRAEFDDDEERTVVATQEELEAAASSGDAPSAPIEAMPALSSVPMTVSAPAGAPIRPRVSTRVLASVPIGSPASHALAKVVPLPTPSAHVHAVPGPQAKPVEKVAEMAAQPLPVVTPPTTMSARRIAVAPVAPAPATIALPVPAATSAAWEEDEEPIAPPLLRSHEVDAEETNLVPRGGRGVGIGVAVGAIAALVVSLLLLNKPFVRRLTVASRSTPAQLVAPPPPAAPAPVIAPLEPAAAPLAPSDPAHP
jgi:uncharacterized protein (TIGR02266 family)